MPTEGGRHEDAIAASKYLMHEEQKANSDRYSIDLWAVQIFDPTFFFCPREIAHLALGLQWACIFVYYSWPYEGNTYALCFYYRVVSQSV